MVAVFREVWRVLRDDGTCWVNLGDSYAGSGKGQNGDGSSSDRRGSKQGTNEGTLSGGLPTGNASLKPKDLMGMPWRVALALQADGWWLRSEITWCKKAPMPESVRDRPVTATEKLFLFTKRPRYYFDMDAVRVTNGDSNHNIWNYWVLGPANYPGAHFATFPPALVEPCIKAGCPKGGTVFDPFGGSGTTALVARQLGRDAVMLDLSPEYLELARQRLALDKVDAWQNGSGIDGGAAVDFGLFAGEIGE